jgi:hypothetical protein
MRARTDLDFLLYPLATEEHPACPACGTPMTIAVREARGDRPDFSIQVSNLHAVRKIRSRGLRARRFTPAGLLSATTTPAHTHG